MSLSSPSGGNSKGDGELRTALILGGSSGLGLATAKKLARHGYNIIIIHRDRKFDLEVVNKQFQEITSGGSKLNSFNVDVTHPEKRAQTVKEIKALLTTGGKIKVLVHSIAKGNLKPMYSQEKTTLNLQDFQITLNAMALSLYDWTKALIDADLFAADARIVSFTSENLIKQGSNELVFIINS